jgi:rhamnosyl/mannosyltransferase
MDVLQISQFYPPHTGGIERVVQQLSEGLVARGHNVSALSAVSRGAGRADRLNGVRVRRAGSLGELLSVPLAPTLPYHVRRLVHSHDVVHYHLPHPLATISHLATAPRNVPVVVTYHSDIVRQATVARAYWPFLNHFLERADRILTTSPALVEHSKVLPDYADKCEVVPLAVDLNDYPDCDSAPVSEADDSDDFNVADDELVLLFAGRLIYYKGLEYLIDAMTDIDAILLIAGDGDRREALEARAESVEVAEKVQFLGYVSDERLHRLYDRADLFVLPSSASSEAFGVVQLEAMAHGTPVVNTDLPSGVPWVSVDGETGLTVQPCDSTALATAIEDLLANPDRHRRYGRNARLRVEERFSEERFLDDTEQIYQKLLTAERGQ